MNIKRRLTIRFVLQLATAGAFVLLIVAATFFWALQRVIDIRISSDFASVGLNQLVESSEMGKDGIHFDPQLLEQVKKNGGWLQSLDENGQVEQSYNTPKDVPKSYAPGELVSYWTGDLPFPYGLSLWIQEKNGRPFTLLYGEPNQLGPLLKKIRSRGILSSNGLLVLPTDVTDRLKQLGGYVQLLDSKGSELASYNRPASAPTAYTLYGLALRNVYNERYGFHLTSTYDKETGHTWVVSLPNSSGYAIGDKWLPPEEERIILIAMLAMFTAIFASFLLLSLWQAHRFGVPLLHMLTWLDSLGRAVYQEPVDHRGIQRSRMRSGKWKRRYRIFVDVMHSIDKLSGTLQRDQTLRQQTESLREEWIAGITHDLKTPLVSIKGYAHLLAEPQYDWTVAEVRQFSSTMLEKSAHMEMLINDLAMTYRLKSGARPPESEEIELNSWLEDALKQAATDPFYKKETILFQGAPFDVTVRLYTPWLERIINNLVANALLHNPPDTVLIVSVIPGEGGKGLTIQFADNGTGMDENTVNRLFERYYRGTATSAAVNGTGLGMAISKGLIEAMGGKITVETTLGNGTVIRLIWEEAVAGNGIEKDINENL
ncbi:sensor histidine kinase [Paenibacillus maysiensis]|uniref:sensor histidine kinase n=1 Tax=Paenibacillus maysiensis TaxID=1155954 RepID=UPI000470DA46|nr:HAMP domain-containing sensor histidine kinase [Paenibacillus maysiensis]